MARPGVRGARMNDESVRSRIVAAGTRLFSALGFDATTAELIASTAGVPVSDVRRFFRGNVELYREVMRQANEAERNALSDAIVSFTPTRQAMERLLDAYLDFYASRPDLLGLWLHRRTGDAADTLDLDHLHSQPKLAWLIRVIKDRVPHPDQLEYALWTFPWAVSGFLGSGTVLADGHRRRAFGDPVTGPELESFRAYLHTLAHRLLALPEAVETDESVSRTH